MQPTCFTFDVTVLRVILFDFGGTLDAPGRPWIERFAAAYKGAGLDVPYDRLRAAVGYGTEQAYNNPDLAGFGLRETVAFHVARQFAHLNIDSPGVADTIVADFLAGTVLGLAESRAVLERLSRRFRLGVVSNFYGNVERLLRDADIAPLLALVVDSAVVGIRKPDPRIFTLAVERLGVPARRALFVGDSMQQDIVPARAAGLRTAWLAGAHQPATDYALGADLRLHSLGELEQLA
jgi:FMN phosphatase YigB (HAD superfamily)